MREDPFYHTARWERVRAAILRRDGYICQESKRFGRIVQANTVHHVFPRDEYPEYTWEPWNMISLSAEQHNRMHDRETGKLSAEGRALMRRVARRHGIREHDPPAPPQC